MEFLMKDRERVRNTVAHHFFWPNKAFPQLCYGEIKSPRPSDWTSSTEESSVEKEAIDIVRIKKYFHTQWAESLAFSWATDSDARSLKY